MGILATRVRGVGGRAFAVQFWDNLPAKLAQGDNTIEKPDGHVSNRNAI
jgi:hypothetical protein